MKLATGNVVAKFIRTVAVDFMFSRTVSVLRVDDEATDFFEASFVRKVSSKRLATEVCRV